MSQRSSHIRSAYQAQREESAFLRMYRIEAWLKQKRRCAYCLEPLSRSATTADHLLARSRGGPTAPENIVAACEPCNTAKGSMPITKFKRLIKAPRPGSSMRIWLAHFRRRIWRREERAERRIFRFVGLGG